MTDDGNDQGKQDRPAPRRKGGRPLGSKGRKKVNAAGQELATGNTRNAVRRSISLVVDNGQPVPEQQAISRMPMLASGKGRNVHGLTSKQEAFAAGVASGLTLAAAYRAAYDAAQMSAPAVYGAASELMDNPAVGARINGLVQERERDALHDAAATRRFVLTQLHEHAVSAKVSPSVRLRALELLGKAASLFVERVQTEQIGADAGPEALEQALRARIAGLSEGE